MRLTVVSGVRGLQSMKVPSEHYGGLLVSVLLNDKFPDDIIRRKLEADELDWILDNVLKVFRAEIETRERCGIATAVSTSTLELKKSPQHSLAHKSKNVYSLSDI